VPAGLIADVAAMLMAIYLVQWLFA